MKVGWLGPTSLGLGALLGLLGCSGERIEPPTAAPSCGDGVVQEGEECDEGGENADSGSCVEGCRLASCGDGLLHVGTEECDDGLGNDESAPCMPNCTDAVCGDGFVLAGVEECDDGNSDPKDGCDACRLVREQRTLSLADARAVVIGDAENVQLGHSLAGLGDTNGDGFDDFAIATRGWSFFGSSVILYVFRGPLAGARMASEADALVASPEAGLHRHFVTSAGDVDGDRVDELAITRVFGTSSAFWFPTDIVGTVTLATAPTRLGAGTVESSSTSPVGDLTGDGVDDLVVAIPGFGSDSADSMDGAIFVFEGPMTGSLDLLDAAVTIDSDVRGTMGDQVFGHLDVSGDGQPDLVVRSDRSGVDGYPTGTAVIDVFYGPLSGDSTISDSDVEIISGFPTSLDARPVKVVDIDRDGVGDLLLNRAGGVSIVRGPLVRSGRVGELEMAAIETPEHVISEVTVLGDLDGDGHLDLSVGTPFVGPYGPDPVTVHCGPFVGTRENLVDADILITDDDVDLDIGFRVAGPGDVDGDGTPDLLVSAPGWNDPQIEGQEEGKVFLFSGATLLGR